MGTENGGTAGICHAPAPRHRVVIVTGLSGAGKSVSLKAFEDLGYEAVDNLPIALLPRLLRTGTDTDETLAGPPGEPKATAIGVDCRTRGFHPDRILEEIERLRGQAEFEIRILFLTCANDLLGRRYSETRRRHPLDPALPVAEAIAKERNLMEPLRIAADFVLDTTDLPLPEGRQWIKANFRLTKEARLQVTVMSFGYPRGLPKDADLVFDVRFLQNPHYDEGLRALTGRDEDIDSFIRKDPEFAPFFERIETLVIDLLPLYRKEGKSYLTIAFGCTGGRHRSVFSAEQLGGALAGAGYMVNILHRDMSTNA